MAPLARRFALSRRLRTSWYGDSVLDDLATLIPCVGVLDVSSRFFGSCHREEDIQARLLTAAIAGVFVKRLGELAAEQVDCRDRRDRGPTASVAWRGSRGRAYAPHLGRGVQGMSLRDHCRGD